MELPKRKQIRLRDYDYASNGAYFVTICTHERQSIFGTIMGWFKYQTTKQMNALLGSAGVKCWQRSYHDHVICTEHDYQEIWQYLDTNSLKWADDCYYMP